MKSQPNWIPAEKLSACGANVSLSNGWKAWRNALDRAAPGLFPPDIIVQVKAIACELPAIYEVPLSRWSAPEIARYACQSGLVATLSGSTVWRWLHEDAIKPWQHRSWVFQRTPLSLPRKQDESWTSTKGFGTARSCEKMNLFCVPMTRPVSRLGLGGILPILLNPVRLSR